MVSEDIEEQMEQYESSRKTVSILREQLQAATTTTNNSSLTTCTCNLLSGDGAQFSRTSKFILFQSICLFHHLMLSLDLVIQLYIFRLCYYLLYKLSHALPVGNHTFAAVKSDES